MSALLDAEPVVLEDLDFTPTCDWKSCEREAIWEVVLTCGCAGVVCEKHRRLQAEYDADSHGAWCNHCSTPRVHVARWTRL